MSKKGRFKAGSGGLRRESIGALVFCEKAPARRNNPVEHFQLQRVKIKKTHLDVFRIQAGAMNRKRCEYHHLSSEERSLAYTMREGGASLRIICRALGRPVTAAGSLSREFQRNQSESPFVRERLDSYERARWADDRAKERRKIPRKNFKLKRDDELRQFVENLLASDQASPRDISHRVKHFFSEKRISASTIYAHTKRHRGLLQHLRRRGEPPRQRVTPRRKPRNDSVSRRRISERSDIVARRIEFGHYEADTIVSPRGGSKAAILTVRELGSRQRWFFKLSDLRGAVALAVLRGFFSQLPPHMRRTLTVDNGGENSELHELESVFSGFRVYYCDPYCAWQRGSVENANGEFRWYYPKGTDFKDVSVSDIREVQLKLNRRCLDCLGGRPSEEVFREALENPPRIVLAESAVLSSAKSVFEAAGLRFERSSSLYLPSRAQLG